MGYGISKSVKRSYDETVERTVEELKKEGFGVLTTIDVRETLRKKLDVDFPRYIILGACNPPFAYETLQAEEQAGLLLPCNVIVYEKEGETFVSAFDPMLMLPIMGNDRMRPIAQEVQARLKRVIERV